MFKELAYNEKIKGWEEFKSRYNSKDDYIKYMKEDEQLNIWEFRDSDLPEEAEYLIDLPEYIYKDMFIYEYDSGMYYLTALVETGEEDHEM